MSSSFSRGIVLSGLISSVSLHRHCQGFAALANSGRQRRACEPWECSCLRWCVKTHSTVLNDQDWVALATSDRATLPQRPCVNDCRESPKDLRNHPRKRNNAARTPVMNNEPMATLAEVSTVVSMSAICV
jgi:hypothetical protein